MLHSHASLEKACFIQAGILQFLQKNSFTFADAADSGIILCSIFCSDFCPCGVLVRPVYRYLHVPGLAVRLPCWPLYRHVGSERHPSFWALYRHFWPSKWILLFQPLYRHRKVHLQCASMGCGFSYDLVWLPPHRDLFGCYLAKWIQ